MRFRCERDVLTEALSVVGRATDRAGVRAALSGILLQLEGDRLELTGSDLELTMTATLTVGGGEDGRAVIPAKLALEIVRSLEPGAVEVSAEADVANITGGRSEFSLQLQPAEEYPQLNDPAGDQVELEASVFADGLHQVLPAASSDEDRRGKVLTGVYLTAESGGLRLVSTDSFRLAVRDLPGTSALSEGNGVLIPSRALQEVARLLSGSEELTLVLGEHDASFSVGDVRLSTRLIEGEFPRYQNLIPSSYPNRLLVGRQAFIEALKRVRLVAQAAGGPSPVKLSIEADGLELRARAQDVGDALEQLDAKLEGTELVVAFNPQFLLEGLEVTPGDEISLETEDAKKPAVIRSTESPDFLYLLMPVRISD